MKLVTITLLTAGALALPSTGLAASAQENWDLHCAKCHAADGSGNTKVGQRLHLKDYTLPENQGKFTDTEAHAAIKDGVKNDAGKFTMNPYAEKLTDPEISELVTFVRGLKK